jgi:hypothetical protein
MLSRGFLSPLKSIFLATPATRHVCAKHISPRKSQSLSIFLTLVQSGRDRGSSWSVLVVFGAKTRFAQSGGANALVKKTACERDPLRELHLLHALTQFSRFIASSENLVTGKT